MTAYTDGSLRIRLSSHTDCEEDDRIEQGVIVFDPETCGHFFTLHSRHIHVNRQDDFLKPSDRIYNRKGLHIEFSQN
jgi:hypothetical protein